MHLPMLPFITPIPLLPPMASTTALLADTLPNGSTGALPSDLLYIGGVVAVAAFGGRQVFDSVFAENEEYRPPLPGNLPFLGDGAREDPAARAEALRQRLQTAAQAGDIETAYRTEKELKQVGARGRAAPVLMLASSHPTIVAPAPSADSR